MRAGVPKGRTRRRADRVHRRGGSIRRIVVTGGSGKAGRWIVKSLGDRQTLLGIDPARGTLGYGPRGAGATS